MLLQEVADGLRIEQKGGLFGGGSFHPRTVGFLGQLCQGNLLGANQAIFLSLVGADVQSAGNLQFVSIQRQLSPM